MADRTAPSIPEDGTGLSGGRGCSPSPPRDDREAASSMPRSSPQTRVGNRTDSGALEAHSAVELRVACQGRVAEQDPLAVPAPLDLAPGDQLAERGRDRPAAGADHPREP